MKYWSIEVHEVGSGEWWGVVKRRPDGKVCFLSERYASSAPAFLECAHWLQEFQEDASQAALVQDRRCGRPPERTSVVPDGLQLGALRREEREVSRLWL